MMQDLRMRKLGTTAATINRRKMSCQGAIIMNFVLFIFPLHALAWNIPGQIANGAIIVFILAVFWVEACHLILTIYPDRPEKPRLFQFFDKRVVKKLSWIGILGLGKFFLIEIT